MQNWNIHICNARGRLDPVLDILDDAIGLAQTQCSKVHRPLRLDMVVRATDWKAPEGLEVCGFSYGPGRIDLEVDISKDLEDHKWADAILRSIFHEFHHVLRWDGPGYGSTLGEALVSEGLAQVFLHEMMNCPKEPWENVLDETQLRQLEQIAHKDFEDGTYSHAAWFFGAGQLPNWAGYSLGKAMVEKVLARHGATALESASWPASHFQQATL